MCARPAHLNNGLVWPVKSSYQVGERVTVYCRLGYKLQGNRRSICGRNGKFWPILPVCERKKSTICILSSLSVILLPFIVASTANKRADVSEKENNIAIIFQLFVKLPELNDLHFYFLLQIRSAIFAYCTVEKYYYDILMDRLLFHSIWKETTILMNFACLKRHTIHIEEPFESI